MARRDSQPWPFRTGSEQETGFWRREDVGQLSDPVPRCTPDPHPANQSKSRSLNGNRREPGSVVVTETLTFLTVAAKSLVRSPHPKTETVNGVEITRWNFQESVGNLFDYLSGNERLFGVAVESLVGSPSHRKNENSRKMQKNIVRVVVDAGAGDGKTEETVVEGGKCPAT